MDPENLPAEATSARLVNVHVASDVLFNLPQLQKVTAATLSKLGCGGCHSGFDIRYIGFRESIRARDFIVNTRSLAVTEQFAPDQQVL